MKKLILVACSIIFMFSAFITPRKNITSIYGTIDPADGAAKVWAVNLYDTVVVIPEAGKFSIAIPYPAIWKLVVIAHKPYKDAFVENVRVEEGKSTDAGIIRLLSK